MARIVVGVDGSEGAKHAMAWAVDEARLRRAELDVVHAWHAPHVAVTPLSPTTAVDLEVVEKTARDVLDEAVEKSRALELPTSVRRILVHGSPSGALIDAAKDADLLVVGSRGLGGFKGLMLGSVGHQVSHHAPCPVVIVASPA